MGVIGITRPVSERPAGAHGSNGDVTDQLQGKARP
jgi:hypothetical protein